MTRVPPRHVRPVLRPRSDLGHERFDHRRPDSTRPGRCRSPARPRLYVLPDGGVFVAARGRQDPGRRSPRRVGRPRHELRHSRLRDRQARGPARRSIDDPRRHPRRRRRLRSARLRRVPDASGHLRRALRRQRRPRHHVGDGGSADQPTVPDELRIDGAQRRDGHRRRRLDVDGVGGRQHRHLPGHRAHPARRPSRPGLRYQRLRRRAARDERQRLHRSTPPNGSWWPGRCRTLRRAWASSCA